MDSGYSSDGRPTAHCLLVPYPLQGHINPILQFAKRLAHKRLQVTLALTKFILKSSNLTGASDGSISVREISDGFDDGGRAQAKTVEEYLLRFERIGQVTLTDLIRELSGSCSGRPVCCVVYDPFIPWVADVARGLGLYTAAFFTQSCAVNSVYRQVYDGRLRLPMGEDEAVEVAPEVPALKPAELPSFIYVHGSYPAALEMVVNQFKGVEKVDWVFVNTFYELEDKVINWFSRSQAVKAVGPMIPSMFLDKRLEDDKEYGLSLFKPSSNICMNWLNQQQPRSVIYVSFGSLAELSIEQTQELARALTSSKNPYLWVVRKKEESKLPDKLPSSENGLIVSWCPQLQVLAHNAVGCFITHCGWNSTLEGLSLGVPMVAMPQWTDQSTNAKFIEDVWKVGMRAKTNKEGIAMEEQILDCIKCVMEGGRGEEIRRNATRWKEVARRAVDEGSSSDKNIQEFVHVLVKKAPTGHQYYY